MSKTLPPNTCDKCNKCMMNRFEYFKRNNILDNSVLIYILLGKITKIFFMFIPSTLVMSRQMANKAPYPWVSSAKSAS